MTTGPKNESPRDCTHNPHKAPERASLGNSVDCVYGLGHVEKLLRDLDSVGVLLSVVDDGLAFDGPDDVLTDDILERMRADRDGLITLVQSRADRSLAVESEPIDLGLGPGWICPWCRSGDRLSLAEPEGLRCDRCDGLAFRFSGDGIERCDWVESELVIAPEFMEPTKPIVAPEPSENRAPRIVPVGRSLFDAADLSG